MSENLLHQAIALAKKGKKSEAMPLLQQVLMADPHNELGWLWLADCLPTLDERIAALETFVKMVPDAKRARAGLEALRRTAEAAAPADRIDPAVRIEPGDHIQQADHVDPAVRIVPADPIEPRGESKPAAGKGDERLWNTADSGWSSLRDWQDDSAPAGAPINEEDIWGSAPETPAQQSQTSQPSQPSQQDGNFFFTGALSNQPPEPDQAPPAPSLDDSDDPLAWLSETEQDRPANPFVSEDETNEWPALQQRMQSDPWLREAALNAGLEIDFSDEPPPLEGVFDDAAPEQSDPAVSAFTIPIDDVSAEEFQKIEQRSQAALESRPAIRPLKNQPRAESAQPVKKKPAAKKAAAGPSPLNILMIVIFVIAILGVLALVAGMILTSGFF